MIGCQRDDIDCNLVLNHSLSPTGKKVFRKYKLGNGMFAFNGLVYGKEK